MIKINPYRIYTREPYFPMEIKGRGTAFCFYFEENKHLNNVKLVGEEVEINGDVYLVKAFEKVHRGDDGTNRTAYSVLVDKVNKGIIHQMKEAEINKADNIEITVDDIRQWKKELEEADIPTRQYKIMKYCRHKNDLVTMNLPLQEGDCAICFEETFGKLLKDALDQQWYDPKAQKVFSDFEKDKEIQFKKDCQSGKL